MRALIAGAGIGGLATALLLAQNDWHVELFESSPELLSIGAGVQLSPNAVHVLDKLAIIDPAFPKKLAALAFKPQQLSIYKASNGAVLSTMPLGAQAEARWGNAYYTIHRADLQKLLLDLLHMQAKVTLHLGQKLKDSQDDAHGLTVLFEDTHGAITKVHGDVLIGADGLWSRARSLAGLPGPMISSGMLAYRALVPVEKAASFAARQEVGLWLDTGKHLVAYPVSGGKNINLVAVTKQKSAGVDASWGHSVATATVMEAFSSLQGGAKALLDAATEWQAWPLMDRAPEERWTKGRLALLGDAAHPMLPFLAQGAAQALEDANALVTSLTNINESTVASALKAYEVKRRTHTARVQKEARANNLFLHCGGGIAFARNLALKIRSGESMMSRYDWLYGNSKIT